MNRNRFKFFFYILTFKCLLYLLTYDYTIQNTNSHLTTVHTVFAGHRKLKVLFSFGVFRQVLRYGVKCSGNLELTTLAAFVVSHFKAFHKVLLVVLVLVIKPNFVFKKPIYRSNHINRILILIGFNIS